MPENKTISILGCGWLGFPLAQSLIEKGAVIKGSTTTPERLPLLEKSGIIPYELRVDKTGELTGEFSNFFEDSHCIIINFPPRRIPDITTIYPAQVAALLPYIKADQKVIFVSSTSVYQNTNDLVTETLTTVPEKDSGKAVLAVEQLLQKRLGNRLTILRLSGLIGYDRVPGRFLARKENVANGNAPINVIHQDDCVGLIHAVIDKECWGVCINGCADKHPLRSVFYTMAARKAGVPPPTFARTDTVSYKIISNEKSKNILNYSYLYPDPLALVLS